MCRTTPCHWYQAPDEGRGALTPNQFDHCNANLERGGVTPDMSRLPGRDAATQQKYCSLELLAGALTGNISINDGAWKYNNRHLTTVAM